MQQRLNALKENLDPENSVKKILIKTATDIFLVKTDEIICCESDQSYSRLYLTNEKVILVSRPLREFDDMLQPAGFFRIHKSFLINLLHFDHYDRTEGGYVVLKNGLRIPVASRKRDQFLQLIENMI